MNFLIIIYITLLPFNINRPIMKFIKIFYYRFYDIESDRKRLYSRSLKALIL